MTQPNKSGLWLAQAATSNPPLEPPLIVILKYQKLQQLQHYQTLCYDTCIGALHHFQKYFSYIMEEARLHGENHRSIASYWQTLLHKIALSAPRYGW